MAAAVENGMVRLEIRDALERNTWVIYEGRTEQTARSTTPSEQVPFPLSGYQAHEDAYLVLLFKSDAADTIVKADSTVMVDITQYSKINGRVVQPFPTTLTKEDLFDAVSVACAAGVWQEVGKIAVPASAVFEPGQGEHGALNTAIGRVYIQFKDDTP